MLANTFPFQDLEKDMRYYRAMLKQPAKAMKLRKICFSEKALDLIIRMLAEEPSDRPSMSEIKEHPWFKTEVATDSDLQNYFNEV
jgi:serine/threonine protein kinase